MEPLPQAVKIVPRHDHAKSRTASEPSGRRPSVRMVTSFRSTRGRTVGEGRSDAASVCELTEALLERIFMSIANRNYRQKMLSGDQIESELYSAFFQIDNKNTDEVNKQSDELLKAIPQ